MLTYDQRGKAQAIRQLAPKAKGGKGQVATLTTPVDGTTDPATDETTPSEPIIETGSGVLLRYDSRSVDGVLILASDRKMLLSPVQANGADVSPPIADRTTIELDDGTSWLVKGSDPLRPAGLTIMYTLQLRGA